ncbi:hypothetical protein HPB47_015122 [Ixodes persulcatus]|uniref:Uncharacterized protein n=1 Tax=Ixodes persulcatus TaxID=34615 RepID=A0AC60QWU8_IXOPE|nr:hypothetical protein HPB47_015122 [Ixodes persulcatus]
MDRTRPVLLPGAVPPQFPNLPKYLSKQLIAKRKLPARTRNQVPPSKKRVEDVGFPTSVDIEEALCASSFENLTLPSGSPAAQLHVSAQARGIFWMVINLFDKKKTSRLVDHLWRMTEIESHKVYLEVLPVKIEALRHVFIECANAYLFWDELRVTFRIDLEIDWNMFKYFDLTATDTWDVAPAIVLLGLRTSNRQRSLALHVARCKIEHWVGQDGPGRKDCGRAHLETTCERGISDWQQTAPESVIEAFALSPTGLSLKREDASEGGLQYLDLHLKMHPDGICWEFKQHAQKPVLTFPNAHSKAVKRGLVKSLLKSSRTGLRPHLTAHSVLQQTERLKRAGYPEDLVANTLKRLITTSRAPPAAPVPRKKRFAVIPYSHNTAHCLKGLASRFEGRRCLPRPDGQTGSPINRHTSACGAECSTPVAPPGHCRLAMMERHIDARPKWDYAAGDKTTAGRLRQPGENWRHVDFASST